VSAASAVVDIVRDLHALTAAELETVLARFFTHAVRTGGDEVGRGGADGAALPAVLGIGVDVDFAARVGVAVAVTPAVGLVAVDRAFAFGAFGGSVRAAGAFGAAAAAVVEVAVEVRLAGATVGAGGVTS